jgi:hypothetical protein
MSFEDIQTASVIRYLWVREAEQGETEGRKARPVAVGVRLKRIEGDLLLLFPITTKQPEQSRFAAEIPATAGSR